MQPLTGMVSSANAGLRWLSSSTPDVERARVMLSQIVAAGHRAADVVRAIRSIFKREDGARQLVGVNGVIVVVLDLVRNDLDRNDIELETRLSEDLPMVLADPVQLQQMLLNLVLNAVDAMKSVVPQKSGLLRIQSRIEGDGIGIDVEDTGVGVDPEMLDQIFEPLVTTKREGLGLGLSICRSIVDIHRGRIWASLRQPRGLAFHVYLPAAGSEM
jgi:C4-dicarboxylate-specific signal transduction histidine kinase